MTPADTKRALELALPSAAGTRFAEAVEARLAAANLQIDTDASGAATRVYMPCEGSNSVATADGKTVVVLWQKGEEAPVYMNADSVSTLAALCQPACVAKAGAADPSACDGKFTYGTCPAEHCKFTAASVCNGVEMTNALGSVADGGKLACDNYCAPGECSNDGVTQCTQSSNPDAPGYCYPNPDLPAASVTATCAPPANTLCGHASSEAECHDNLRGCVWDGSACAEATDAACGARAQCDGACAWNGSACVAGAGLTQYSLELTDGREMQLPTTTCDAFQGRPLCAYQSVYGMGLCGCNAAAGVDGTQQGGGHRGVACPLPQHGLGGFAVGPGSFNLSASNCPDVKCEATACAGAAGAACLAVQPQLEAVGKCTDGACAKRACNSAQAVQTKWSEEAGTFYDGDSASPYVAPPPAACKQLSGLWMAGKDEWPRPPCSGSAVCESRFSEAACLSDLGCSWSTTQDVGGRVYDAAAYPLTQVPSPTLVPSWNADWGCAISARGTGATKEEVVAAAKAACGASADCAGFNLNLNNGDPYAMLFSAAATEWTANGWAGANTVYRKDGEPCAPCAYTE